MSEQRDPWKRIGNQLEPIVDIGVGMFWFWLILKIAVFGIGMLMSLPILGLPATVVLIVLFPGIDPLVAFLWGTGITWAFIFAIGFVTWLACKACGQNPWKW